MRLKSKKNKKNSFFFLFAISLLFSLISCASKPPEILQTRWNIYAYLDRVTNTRYQALSLFLNLNDPEGIDDIEKIYLINDKHELFWKLDDSNWVKEKVGTSTWIGSNKIVTTDRKTFPRGNYRVIVYDFGGNSTETNIPIETPHINIAHITFPSVIIKGNTLFLQDKRSRVTKGEIWIYRDKSLVISSAFRNKRIDITNLIKSKPILANGFKFELYSYNPKYKIHLLTGPFYFEKEKTEEVKTK